MTNRRNTHTYGTSTGSHGRRSSTPRSAGRVSGRHGGRHAGRHAGGQLNDFSGLGRGGGRRGKRRGPVVDQSVQGEPTGLDKTALRIPRPNGDIVLTRRNFLYGALGVGVLAAAGVGVKTFTDARKEASAIDVLSVAEEDVTESTDLTEAGYQGQLALSAEVKLPYGTLMWASDDDYAALLVPTATGAPLTQVGLLRLSSGYWFTVLNQALGYKEGFEIYDVRASSKGVIWTEVDILEGLWRIYTARLDDSSIASPTLVDEGNSEWETPTLAICGNRVFWQVLPQLGGPRAKEESVVKSCTIGQSTGEVVLSSMGRMSTPLYALDNGIVATPRVDTAGTYHQLTLINASDLEIADSLVLPASMKPLEAGYGSNGFTFSFEGIYSYGDGIANLGTYTPKIDARKDEYSGIPWFHFNRTPSAPPCWCGDYFVVKSSKSVVCCDLENDSYFYFDVLSGADTYGEYLASTGIRKRIVTFTSVNDTPINGSAESYCLARIWSA